MASRASLNKVLLIGNLTRDPELRYTPQGAAVCTFGLATNRTYVSSDGQKKEDAEFHRIVSWNKLAELCSQLLTKGRKVYVEGRLQTRTWQTPAGEQRNATEIVIEDMRLLDPKRPVDEIEIPEDLEIKEGKQVAEIPPVSEPAEAKESISQPEDKKSTRPAGGDEKKKKTKKDKETKAQGKEEEDILEDLPF